MRLSPGVPVWARIVIAVTGASALAAPPLASAEGGATLGAGVPWTASTSSAAHPDLNPTTLAFGAPPPASPASGSAQRPTQGGLFAAAHGYWSTGAYGAPLIDGCAWATWVSRCQYLTTYGNGNSLSNVGCGPPFGCTFGLEFQCVQLAQRYAYYAWGEPASWYGYGGVGGNAADMWTSGPALPIPLQRFANGGGVPPEQGDLLIFGPGWLGGYWDGAGHVAVVRDVGSTYVDVVQQNATPTGTDRFPMSGTTVSANGYTPVLGWLRNTIQSPVALGATNVAGAPHAVSDRPGDVDVVWRGTDNRIWTVNYRNGRWAGQSSPISAPIAASDPAVVSTAPGTIDAFWQGVDGMPWEATYQAGYFGSGTWRTPLSINTSTMASPPAAVDIGGAIEVFWKGIDGTLWADRYAGAWGGALPLGTGQVAGAPVAVSSGSTTGAVLWRDPAGEVWSDVAATWGFEGAVQISSSPAAAEPSGVESALGLDAFWAGTDGNLWHNHLAPAGAWGVSDPVASVSMVGSPAVAAPSAGSLAVDVATNQHSLAVALYTSAGWVGPELLSQNYSGSGLAALSYVPGAVDVFWRTADGTLWYAAACAGCAAPNTPPVLPLP